MLQGQENTTLSRAQPEVGGVPYLNVGVGLMVGAGQFCSELKGGRPWHTEERTSSAREVDEIDDVGAEKSGTEPPMRGRAAAGREFVSRKVNSGRHTDG